MTEMIASDIQAGQVVLPCRQLDETLAFFVDGLGFKIETIFPADSPRVAVVFGYGTALRLERDESAAAASVLRLESQDPSVGEGKTITAPDGTKVEIVPPQPGYVMPEGHQSFVHTQFDGQGWGVGRAGMLYRDLIPDRQGDRFIASHIRIPTGGPVPDYVHFHKVRFQMIYCAKGWVRLVYEDQGEPFVMKAGDCVLQPPEIRHRVLECSDGLEVVEIGCPAEHPTMVEHRFDLPTGKLDPERDFSGQRFVRHIAETADWMPWRADGFRYRDLGIEQATDGLAGARVVKAEDTAAAGTTMTHDGEFLFFFVTAGEGLLTAGPDGPRKVSACDALVVPAGMNYGFSGVSAEFELLEVSLPGALPSR